ncbi:asparagine-linked glycosylation protein [Rhizophlyctis rosea]|nr:asparagine-linked glycosylation protein [Rhizophlyctis rosea]
MSDFDIFRVEVHYVSNNAWGDSVGVEVADVEIRLKEKGNTVLSDLRAKRKVHRASLNLSKDQPLIGFFHPYCDAGGGGERVLWVAIRAVQKERPQAVCLIYSWDKLGSKDELLSKVKDQFGVSVDGDRLLFKSLKSWRWLEAKTYKRLTLIGQSLGSVWVAWEALNLAIPDVFVDMLGKVENRVTDYNNVGAIARNPVLSFAKLCKRVNLVYPPCDTKTLQSLPLEPREPLIVSIAQFRPEKMHIKQIEAFQLLMERHANKLKDVRLVVIGSVRNEGDQEVARRVQDSIDKYGLQDRVTIVENVTYAELQSYLRRASVGLHTMLNEHFGISVVEYMAAGIIPVANNSGGPNLDIVVSTGGEKPGYLASTVEEYADALYQALTLSSDRANRLRKAARSAVCNRFTEEAFGQRFLESLAPLIPEGPK